MRPARASGLRTENKPYVATSPLKQALQGHEAAVLDALDIPWREGRPHIRCPYPGHPDENPSWRWEEKTARALCTCLGNRSDSVIDVVMKVKALEFEEAKVFIAEALGRGDLIKMAGKSSGTSYPKMDATSLLSPPADNRDDALPRKYLAFRLGIAADEIVMPATLSVGIKRLGYFEARPGRQGSKPVCIGHYPCAVFQTKDLEGRTHAHRIYLAPDGAGKANLGIAADGHPREAKKSAKNLDTESTAGCAVFWGSPDSAETVVVCEGIETGQAIAQALRAEMDAGQVAVAAAISAPGLEAFKPRPQTKRLIIAADRDEQAGPDGAPGNGRGEQAARKLALTLHGTLAVSIALPGRPGQKIDWLDVYAGDGPAAVTQGILEARPFSPSGQEEEEAALLARMNAELSEVTATYPLPQLDLTRLEYRRTPSGQIKVHKYVKTMKDAATGEMDEVFLPVCTPIGVPARLKYIEQRGKYGLRIVVQGMDGDPREVDLERADIAISGGTEIRSALFAAGLRTEGDGDALALQMIKAACPQQEILVVSKPGWHQLPGTLDRFFVCPSGEIIGDGGQAIELALVSRLQEPVTSGSLEGWKAAISSATRLKNCPHFMLGVLAGLAGPIVSLCGLDTCGINLSGLSSSGKSTAQRLGVSAWSTTGVGAGLFQSMRTTANAIELLAQRSSGTILALDEMGHADGRDVAKMIYSIAGGVGKARMTASAKLKDSYAWSTFALLSGECSLEEKVRAEGGSWVAGMAVRLCDIDVTGINRTLDQETLDQINEVSNNYGHAGPAFVRYLVESGLHQDPDALRARILKVAHRTAGANADSVHVRAAIPFAILYIAGELAKAAGLLPEDAPLKEALTWAWSKFQGSTDALALTPDDQAIESLRTWIASKWDVTIKYVYADDDEGDRSKHSNREAQGWYDHDAVYIPTKMIREACGGTVKELHIAKVLDERELLAKRESNRFALRYVPRIGYVPCYALKASEFGRVQAEVGDE